VPINVTTGVVGDQTNSLIGKNAKVLRLKNIDPGSHVGQRRWSTVNNGTGNDIENLSRKGVDVSITRGVDAIAQK